MPYLRYKLNEQLETMRLHFYKNDKMDEPEVVSIREAKKLLKKEGGSAWTEHYDRDGGMFESSPIVPGNNSRVAYNVTYNHHL